MESTRNEKIRILIADDHPMMIAGIRNVLQTRPDFEVVGQAVNGKETLEKIKLLSPGIAIIDINMPLMNGLEVAAVVRDEYPETKVVILSMYDDREYVTQFLDSGASAYVLKKNSPEELIEAIDAVLEGEAYFSTSIAESILRKHHARSQKSPSALSEREEEILILVAQGFRNKQIAEKLLISARTVSTHRDRIKQKLNLSTTADLIRYAYSTGLVKLTK